MYLYAILLALSVVVICLWHIVTRPQDVSLRFCPERKYLSVRSTVEEGAFERRVTLVTPRPLAITRRTRSYLQP